MKRRLLSCTIDHIEKQHFFPIWTRFSVCLQPIIQQKNTKIVAEDQSY